MIEQLSNQRTKSKVEGTEKMTINTTHNIDALQGLKQLPDNFVDCIITSPPYFQLRDYGHKEQIGLETTMNEYIAKLTAIFKEAYRVLKPTGTLWLNIGDSYAGSGAGDKSGGKETYNDYLFKPKVDWRLPNKSLMNIPARLAIKLQDECGYVLRNMIIWHKPNAMPSSVTDRFTIDYELIYFFTKKKTYYFKQLKEPMLTEDITNPRGSKGVIGQSNSGRRKQDDLGKPTYTVFNARYEPPQDLMRNMRCVWSIPTEASTIDHFATYPQEIVKRCIEAGCQPGGLVLDMFMGSGTTAYVALAEGLNYIGFEINPKYCEIANTRAKTAVQQLKLFDI